MVQTPQDDFWRVSTAVSSAVDPPSPVRLVSAAGGLVIAVGASLHMLRPGSRRIRSRALPPEGEVVAVAAEPWSPFRLAIATRMSVGVYTGHLPYEPVFNIMMETPEVAATHVAWSRREGKTVLYVRQRSGQVMMTILEDRSVGTLTGPRVAAIAGDPSGVFATIDLEPEAPATVGDAWLLPVGATKWTTRWVDCGGYDETKAKVHLAVHGAAVAYSIEPLDLEHFGGAEVSWEEEDDDDDESLSFEHPPGVFLGPIVFQSERVIFGAHNIEGRVDVLRWARNGSFTRIARLGLDDDWKGTEATVTGIAWDDERRALWAASPELGLIKLTEPGKDRVSPN
jgi:hypothetical protein